VKPPWRRLDGFEDLDSADLEVRVVLHEGRGGEERLAMADELIERLPRPA
jgi:hypothetical protein